MVLLTATSVVGASTAAAKASGCPAESSTCSASLAAEAVSPDASFSACGALGRRRLSPPAVGRASRSVRCPMIVVDASSGSAMSGVAG